MFLECCAETEQEMQRWREEQRGEGGEGRAKGCLWEESLAINDSTTCV
jgi:hypothetical protein